MQQIAFPNQNDHMPNQNRNTSWARVDLYTRNIRILVVLFLTVLGTTALAQEDTPNHWQFQQIMLSLADYSEAKSQLDQAEHQSRVEWLKSWKPGVLSKTAKKNEALPTTELEGILESIQHEALVTELRQKLNDVDKAGEANALGKIHQAITDHPNDLALLQFHLHWLDDIKRRKRYLTEVDVAAKQLLSAIEARDDSDANITVKQFTLYRRARAMAYRELPDVVAITPIKNQEEHNAQLREAYEELIESAGTGKPEFILLEIRMHRREKRFGTALGLLEKYGSTVSPKWYLKKRRDLLKELGWDHPYKEAADIYAKAFPEEVKKEKEMAIKQAGPKQRQ